MLILWPVVGDYFFPSATLLDRPYQESSLRQAIGHAVKRAGAGHWTPYMLRHLYLTLMAVDHGLEVAAKVAGHSEVSTTMIYVHQPDAKQITDSRARNANALGSVCQVALFKK